MRYLAKHYYGCLPCNLDEIEASVPIVDVFIEQAKNVYNSGWIVFYSERERGKRSIGIIPRYFDNVYVN